MEIWSCVSMSVCLNLCVHWANSSQTGAKTLHLHRPFPACRVIPAPSLPALPSHTYQPLAAVPLPESGSSSLDSVDKQGQPVHLTLFISLFSNFLCCFLQIFSDCVILNFHFISPGNTLLNRVLLHVSRHIYTKSLLYFSAFRLSQGVLPTSKHTQYT